MKETTANEITGHRIRIEGPVDKLDGFFCQVTDLETGQLIENIDQIQLVLDAREHNVARLRLAHIRKIPEADTGYVDYEQVTVQDPEIALTAFVEDVN